ncbi:HNH endonuclease signature motif containing protein [Flavobacterium sp. GNP002]
MRTAEYKGYTIYEDGRVLGIKGTFLKPGLSGNGYYTVAICYDGTKKSVPIHRLIAESFIPNPEKKIYVNHINSIRTDNRIENLEWSTPSENAIHMFKNGRCNKTIDSVIKRISKPVIDKSTGKTYPSAKNAALILGINRNTLVAKLCGKRKNNTTYEYL